MDLKTEEHVLGNGQMQVAVKGSLNAITVLDLKEQQKRLVRGGFHTQVLDLTGVTYIDSSGLAALVSVLRATREAGGTFLLVGLNGQTISLFRLSRLDRLFSIYPSVEVAAAHLKPGSCVQAI